jgi:hypothetical protein
MTSFLEEIRAFNDEIAKLLTSGAALAVRRANIAALTEKFQISDTKRLDYENYQKQALEDGISARTSEITEIQTVVEPALLEGREKRLNLYLDYSNLLMEEKKLGRQTLGAAARGSTTGQRNGQEARVRFELSWTRPNTHGRGLLGHSTPYLRASVVEQKTAYAAGYVPSDQPAKYSSCSGVSRSILIPIDSSFSLATRLSSSSGTR